MGDSCAYEQRTIDCGLVAKTALQDLTVASEVVCRPVDKTADGQLLVRCTANGYDLSEGMIYTGWGRALPKAPKRYHQVEADAKARKRGLWKGAFPASVNDLVAN